MSGEVAKALRSLLERSGSSFPVEYDPEWSSPCILLPPDAEGRVQWQPVLMDPPAKFEGLHPDLQEFFGSFWGGPIEATHSGDAVLISVAWNEVELLNIQQTVAQHLTAGSPIFIAGTSSDWYFGVNNDTGEVWLCEPGYPPIHQVSPSLATFLIQLLSGIS